jgi:hypothetical protein
MHSRITGLLPQVGFNGIARDAQALMQASRPCTSGMVAELYAKHTARKRPQGAAAVAKLDDSSGFC